jgi:hypothetical protein
MTRPILLDPDAVRLAIEETDGKVFVVVFIKKDETLRRMRARREVNRDVKGVGKSYDSADHGLIDVFDMEDKSKPGKRGRHKSIPADRVVYIQCGDVVLGESP